MAHPSRLSDSFKQVAAHLKNKSDYSEYKRSSSQVISRFKALWKMATAPEKPLLALTLLDTLVEEARTITQHSTVSSQGVGESTCLTIMNEISQPEVAKHLSPDIVRHIADEFRRFSVHFEGQVATQKMRTKARKIEKAATLCSRLSTEMQKIAR